jgi:hypothetical protein
MIGVLFWPSLRVAGLVASMAVQAVQATVADDHSAYFGGRTLNRELSSSLRTTDGPDGGGRDGGGGRGRGGTSGGGFGGSEGRRGFGGPGGAGVPGGSPAFDPKEMERTMALVQELMTPPPIRS